MSTFVWNDERDPEASASRQRRRSSMQRKKAVTTAATTMMQPIALLAPALRRPPRPSRPSAARAEPSACRRVLRLAVVLVGSFILVVSLVDPLRGSDRFDVHPATQDNGVRHE
jgi:hypothetical protein